MAVPTLASGVVQPAAQPGGGRTGHAMEAGKTPAALRGLPEDAVGLASIEIVETPWAPRNHSQPGRRLRAGMEELKRTCRVLGDVRGIRLMNGIEIIDPDTGTPSPVLAATISQHTLANRLFVSHRLSGTVGGHNIRLAPDRDTGPDRPLPDYPGKRPASRD
jgi:4-aminobutyrate aminotransferase-like enzyme